MRNYFYDHLTTKALQRLVDAGSPFSVDFSWVGKNNKDPAVRKEASKFNDGKIKAIMEAKWALMREWDLGKFSMHIAWTYLYQNIRNYLLAENKAWISVNTEFLEEISQK